MFTDAQDNTKRAPSYLTDRVIAIADLQSHAGLCSASTNKYQTPMKRIKFGKRGFSYTQDPLRGILYRPCSCIGPTATFKIQLKTVLFRRAFLDSTYILIVFISDFMFIVSFTVVKPGHFKM